MLTRRSIFGLPLALAAPAAGTWWTKATFADLDKAVSALKPGQRMADPEPHPLAQWQELYRSGPEPTASVSVLFDTHRKLKHRFPNHQGSWQRWQVEAVGLTIVSPHEPRLGHIPVKP